MFILKYISWEPEVETEVGWASGWAVGEFPAEPMGSVRV